MNETIFKCEAVPPNTALIEEMDKCKSILFRYFQDRDAKIVESLMRKVFSDTVVDIIRKEPKIFIPMFKATGIRVYLDGNQGWIVIGAYNDQDLGIRVAETRVD